MDPLTIVLTALTAGAAAAAKDVAGQAVEAGYKRLKALIVHKFGGEAKVEAALEALEQRPQSKGRQGILKEQLATAKVDGDAELIQQARVFLGLLKEHGLLSGPSYQATVTGSGAIAQGPGAMAAGEAGIAVRKDVDGGINLSRLAKG